MNGIPGFCHADMPRGGAETGAGVVLGPLSTSTASLSSDSQLFSRSLRGAITLEGSDFSVNDLWLEALPRRLRKPVGLVALS
jgi:hypothetical protein